MSAPLVGREEELQRVELFLKAARHAPRALVIEGEAGAGKTSIWQAALAGALRAGSRTLVAHPAEAETSFAYAALGDLLGDNLDALAELPSRQRRALEVALLLDDEGDERPDQQSVALAVLAVFRRLAEDDPLVVAVDELVGARLQALSSQARRALAAAATLAQPTVGLVETVAGDGCGGLDEAEQAHIVVVRDGRVRFTHPLLASGAYAAIDASVRRELHTRAGAEVADPEERARHLALGATGPDEVVANALETAASRAEARGAPPAAAELYERAVRLTPPGARTDVLRRTMHAAFSTFQMGDGRRARMLLDAVVSELPPGRDRARALIDLARVRSYDDDIRAAEALFRQALDEAGADDELLAAAGDDLALPSAGALTPTERRVADLVAEGIQTKQVAAALFVSAKTVEGHLTNIYAKLGINSRAELARAQSRASSLPSK